MNMGNRNDTLVVLMLGLLCLLGWMFLRGPGQLLAAPGTEAKRAFCAPLEEQTRPEASYRSAEPTLATRRRVQEAYGKLPLYFVENRGQLDAQVAYSIQGRDTSVYFANQGLTFALTGRREHAGAPDARFQPVAWTRPALPAAAPQRWAVKLDFVGANPAVKPQGQDRTSAVVSYFKGPQARWKTGLATYASVVYRDLWPGIDLMYSGTVNRLKYQYVVQPGAPVEQIRLRYRGVTQVRVNKSGQLEVQTPVGGFQDDKPYAYQEVEGRRVEVEAVYELEGDGYGFRVGEYDRSRPLVLDPAVLVYSGYIGGSGIDTASGIAVDRSGNAYIAGYTESTEASFPVVVGPDLTLGARDAFVAKVNAAGTALVYAGYIGGSGFDSAGGIAVDGSGNAYVSGVTDGAQAGTAAGFPLVVGPDLTYNGDSDAFVAKVNEAGTALVYAGYIGGSGGETARGIAVDGSGNAYVTGSTTSSQASFPVRVGPDLTHNGSTDAFVVKVNAAGTALVYAGYIGGSAGEGGAGIAVDGAGNAYVTGVTLSTEASFPVVVGPDLTYNDRGNPFVAKVNAAGTALVYCGYIGSGAGRGIAVDAFGNAYVVGSTESTEASFPVLVGPDLTYNGGTIDAFVAKVNAAGTALVYAGYIGGSGNDFGNGIAVDGSGNAYVTGVTFSTDASFPVVGGPDLTYNDRGDAFVAKVNTAGTGLVYASYVGGALSAPVTGTSGNDQGLGIAVDGSGDAYVTGQTASTEASFPAVLGPDLTFNGGDYDVFVAKISFSDTPTPPPSAAAGGVVGAGLSTPRVRQISPNAIVSVFGSNFAPPGTARGVTTADLVSGRLPTRLAGVCVEIGSQRAPMFFVSPTQLNIQAPLLPPSGNVAVQLIVNCGAVNELRSNAEMVPVQAATPEFFFFMLNPDGRNPIAALNASTPGFVGRPGLIPGAAFAPARPGDVVTLFMTGLGPTNPAFQPGELPDRASSTVLPVTVSLGGTDLAPQDVLYAGVAPTLAGVYQINIRLPATTVDGDVSVRVRIVNFITPPGGFLTVSRQ